MSEDTLSTIRREAQERGLRWADVEDAYREVKVLEWEKRQRPNEVRQHAWMMATASVPGCWSFWRHGFSARWGKKLAKGQDYTCVPGYDEIGQQIGTAFPEYGGDDGTEQLFEFLFSPYDKVPSRTELYRKALELAERECRMQKSEFPKCPFDGRTVIMELDWLQNEPQQPPRPDYDDGTRDRQQVMFAGMDCLSGQLDLFATDGEAEPESCTP